MLAFSNDYYGMIFRATQSVELFCAYYLSDWELCISTNSACNGNVYRDGNSLTAFYL
ncbi:hypothetical protein Rgna01_33990 [Mediterraneibacter gnavus]|nr:hypothetical protein Rgna01_33990 [Mediterraneibacter gnavus]